MLYALILFIVVFCFFLWLDSRKPENFPHGPAWYPFIGSMMALKQARDKTGMLCKAIFVMAKAFPKFNGVLGFKIGKDRVVMVLSGDALREMMTNEDLDGRPTGPFYETRTWEMRRGVLLTDEEFWIVQRRFVIRHLKEFGFARKGMSQMVENEAEFCLNDIKKMVAKSPIIPMQGIFSVYVLNTLWLMMAGIRYTPENKDLKLLQSLLYELFLCIDMMGALFSHFPFLRFVAPKFSGYNQFVDLHKRMHKFIGTEVENHKQTFSPTDEPRDLIDVYLKILQSSEYVEGIETFSEKQLLAVCLDMFVAGSETTTKTIGFAFLHLVREQNVQDKVQAEIDLVVGQSRLPCLEDRPNMPYCEATVLEALRMFMANTFGIPHRALRDTKLRGFDIPKDTMLVASFRGMMLDEKLWKDPMKFDPSRFLGKDGKICVPENYYPFGVGKHRCMGEMMGRANLFMFITTLCQQFTFKVPPGHKIPSDVPKDGATPSVQPYSALIEARF